MLSRNSKDEPSTFPRWETSPLNGTVTQKLKRNDKNPNLETNQIVKPVSNMKDFWLSINAIIVGKINEQ